MSYSLIKPVTPNVSFSVDSPAFDEDIKSKIDQVAYIQINNTCVCDDPSVNNEYQLNIKEYEANTCINRRPAALTFLRNALEHNMDTLIAWLGRNGFDQLYSEEEQNAILFIRLVLHDFYVNCKKRPLKNVQNERTPFIEYLVSVFKYYSAVYPDVNFQW
jgi:hypothetical protein